MPPFKMPLIVCLCNRTQTFLKKLMLRMLHQVFSSLKLLASKEPCSKGSYRFFMMYKFLISQVLQNIHCNVLHCRFPPELLKKLTTDCLVMQNHQVYYDFSIESNLILYIRLIVVRLLHY